MYFSLAEPERDYMYSTKAASMKSKADILLLVKRSAAIEPYKLMQICKI